jgi:myosin-crossreactive antigen
VEWVFWRALMMPSCQSNWQATLVTHSFEDVKQEEHRTAITDSYTIVHSAGSSSHSRMARKKIREFDSKRILKEHLKRLAGISVDIKSAQVESPILFELYDCKMMQ